MMTAWLDSRVREVLPDLVARLRRSYPHAGVLITDVEGLSVEVDRRKEAVIGYGPVRGAVLTGFDGLEAREVATSDVTPDGLARAAVELEALTPTGRPGASAAGLPGGAAGPAPPEPSWSAGPAAADFRTPCKRDPALVTVAEKLDLCRSNRDRGLGLDVRVGNAVVRYHERRDARLFADAAGVRSQTLTRVGVAVTVYIAEGGPPRSHGLAVGGTGGFELTAIPEAKWEELAEVTPALLGAERLEAGFYDIVAAPDVAGLIAHEAFGHGVELDMFLRERARARSYLGRPVGSELVDLYDDPTYPGAYGSFFFDDEGQPASRTQIIRKGVFVQGLTDLYSAVRLGVPRTANGRRESFERKTYARMTNTFFGPGSDRLEDMIASIDRGVYLGRADGGMEDPKGWGIQVEVRWGREIRNGKLTDRYFSPIGLTGYVPDLLGSVSMASAEVVLDPGLCGKGYKEIVNVASGGPYIKAKARLA